MIGWEQPPVELPKSVKVKPKVKVKHVSRLTPLSNASEEHILEAFELGLFGAEDLTTLNLKNVPSWARAGIVWTAVVDYIRANNYGVTKKEIAKDLGIKPEHVDVALKYSRSRYEGWVFKEERDHEAYLPPVAVKVRRCDASDDDFGTCYCVGPTNDQGAEIGPPTCLGRKTDVWLFPDGVGQYNEYLTYWQSLIRGNIVNSMKMIELLKGTADHSEVEAEIDQLAEALYEAWSQVAVKYGHDPREAKAGEYGPRDYHLEDLI